MDLLKATSILYGNCTQHPNGDIYIKGVNPTSTQLEQINIKALELENEYKETQYIRDRKKAYNKLNQYEMQFDDLQNGTTTWKDSILAIKTQYPKPL